MTAYIFVTSPCTWSLDLLLWPRGWRPKESDSCVSKNPSVIVVKFRLLTAVVVNLWGEVDVKQTSLLSKKTTSILLLAVLTWHAIFSLGNCGLLHCKDPCTSLCSTLFVWNNDSPWIFAPNSITPLNLTLTFVSSGFGSSVQWVYILFDSFFCVFALLAH